MKNTVSVEQINVNHKSKLATEVYSRVKKAYADKDNNTLSVKEFLADIQEIIRRNTKIKVSLGLRQDSFNFSAAMVNIAGNHSSVNKNPVVRTPLFQKDPLVLKYIKGSVDLTKVQVEGTFTEIPAYLIIGDGAMDFWDDDEFTAMILHEVGHLFWAFATIGDYVWMSYYLQEGVEVMLGTRADKYSVKGMTLKQLTDNVDKETAQEIKKDPSVTTVRKAIIELYTDTGRGWISSVSDANSLKRDEQLADWFASRLGFGLPLARAVTRISSTQKSRRIEWLRSVAVIPTLLIPGINIATISWVSYQFMRHSDISSSYDNPVERARKMRRDTISQLTYVKDPKRKKQLLDDIEAFDKLMKPLYEMPVTVEIVGMLLSPKRRRNQQHLRLERQLETFLNNDLFVTHSKLQQYLR